MGRIEEFGTFVKRTYREATRKEGCNPRWLLSDRRKDNLFYKENWKPRSWPTFWAAKLSDWLASTPAARSMPMKIDQIDCRNKDEKDVEDIVQEIYFDIAATDNPTSEPIFWNPEPLLQSGKGSRKFMRARKKRLIKGKTERPEKADEKDIILKIRKASEKIKKSGNLHPKAEKAVDYVLNNFPRDTKECETAAWLRLIMIKKLALPECGCR